MGRDSFKKRGLKIATFANQKGGVGKTSCTLCIGSGLAIAGQKVLMIDGDPQGNLTLLFSDEKRKDLSDLFKELISTSNVVNMDDYIIHSVRENLDILPVYNRNFRNEISENQLSDVSLLYIDRIAGLRNRYDWILIDCSPSNGRLEKIMISSSEVILVPLEFQLFSIAGLSSLLEEIKNCGIQARKNIGIEALIFIKAESRLNRVMEYRNIFQTFYIPIYEVCKSEALPKSIEEKKTIWEYAGSSYIAKDYFNIIEKLFLG